MSKKRCYDAVSDTGLAKSLLPRLRSGVTRLVDGAANIFGTYWGWIVSHTTSPEHTNVRQIFGYLLGDCMSTLSEHAS